MGQKITLKMCGKSFSVTVKSEEEERLSRRAAAEIDARINALQKSYPDSRMEDLLIFVSLNIRVGALKQSGILESLKKEIDSLEKSAGEYLENIDEFGR